MRLDRDFPRGGVPISNYNTYAISLRSNTRNRAAKCKRLVDTTCSQFGYGSMAIGILRPSLVFGIRRGNRRAAHPQKPDGSLTAVDG
jgi:hypothetical protein